MENGQNEIISDHKKLSNEEKHFIKNHSILFIISFLKPLCLLASQTDRQNIYRIVAHVWEESS